MNEKIYSVYDRLSKEWNPPFLAKNDDVAYRIVRNSFRNSTTLDLEEYELHELGEFNKETGVVTSPGAPKKVLGKISSQMVNPVKPVKTKSN